jgi:LuxR family maltose regulon positive regulatory protein
MGDAGTAELIGEGSAALNAGRYAEARERFERSLELEESPEALAGLAEAARWDLDAEVCQSARESAYRLYRDRGDRGRAAGVAVRIPPDPAQMRPDSAVAAGWHARARTLLEGLDDVPERGWLAHQEAEIKFGAGDAVGALAAADTAVEIGCAHPEEDLEHVARAMRGQAMVALGDIDSGMRELDEAAAAAMAGEVASATMSGLIWCYLIYACERVRDVERADQWCRTVRERAEEISNRQLFGFCRTHYANVLTVRGAWSDAERELSDAAADFAAAAPGGMPEADLALAEIRRRQGRTEEAEALCLRHPSDLASQLCLAELAWDRGDVRAAAELLDRRRRRLPAAVVAADLPGLELAARVHVAAGEREAAAEVTAMLAALASTIPARAATAFAKGISAGPTSEEARPSIEDALDGWNASGMPFESARARVALARNLEANGRSEDASRELEHAAETLAKLGSALEPEEIDRPLVPVGGAGAGELSAREVEVLRLVADGLSDGEIAERLFLSPHTVHRHVANIRTKLRQPSRAAAAAQAARDGLI